MIKIPLKSRFFKTFVLIILGLICGLLAWFWQSYKPQETAQFVAIPSSNSSQLRKEPIQPIPIHVDLNQQQVQLGRKLFYDVRLSQDNSIACVTCHQFNNGGIDRLVRSIGMAGNEGVINAPTVFNSSYNFKQFWDGRANSLEEQIQEALFSPEMGNASWSELMNKLQQIPSYITEFKEAYPDGMTPTNLKSAIAIFEQSLLTPNSRFDKFLRGDEKSINDQEKEGYRLFKAYGCIACHQGILLGGNMFQNLGLFGDYFKDRKPNTSGEKPAITKADLGRYNVTRNLEDLHVFKVPSLRNIVLTPPYFHDGSVTTLDAAIQLMAQYQLGREIPQTDIDLIIQFLNTLTGELPK